MKTTSLLALTAALLMSATPLAFAQSGTVGTTVDLSLDANADGTVDATEQAAGDAAANAEVDASIDLSLDTDGDGAVSEAEAAAGAEAEAGVDLSLDTDGDGAVSEAEAAAGAAAETEATECSTIDFAALLSNEPADAAAVAGATSAQVLRLSNCEDGTGNTPSADVLAALTANAAITTVLDQETVGTGEILAVTVDETAVTIYVRDDDEGEAATTAQ